MSKYVDLLTLKKLNMQVVYYRLREKVMFILLKVPSQEILKCNFYGFLLKNTNSLESYLA